jgi:hypothetical protein
MPSVGKPMSTIGNVGRMNSWILGIVKNFKIRAILESTKCLP